MRSWARNAQNDVFNICYRGARNVSLPTQFLQCTLDRIPYCGLISFARAQYLLLTAYRCPTVLARRESWCEGVHGTEKMKFFKIATGREIFFQISFCNGQVLRLTLLWPY